MNYTEWMKKSSPTPTPDRIRAGNALAAAIDAAIHRGLITNYLDIAAALEFDRTNIPQHKAGTRPMNREVVLKYAEVLQCDPESIADDKVRMELSRDLQRYRNDSQDYAVLREYEFTGQTPIKFPRDLLAMAGVDPAQLVTVRINRDGLDDTHEGQEVVLVRSYPDSPIISGVPHVLANNGDLYMATVVKSGDGYIVTPGSPYRDSPEFYSQATIESGKLVLIGQVFWRISREI